MTTSSSTNFNLSRDDVITRALELLQVIGAGETVSTQDTTTMASWLNMMIKGWQRNLLLADKRRVGYVFLSKGVNSYSLNNGSSDANATQTFYTTNTSAAASSADTTITVDSITDISNGDKIGVELSDGTLHWTTVNGAPSGSTVTLTVALTDDVAVDARVFTYTTRINRPVAVLEVVRRDFTAGATTFTDIALRRPISHQEYWSQSSKNLTTSKFTAVMYDRQRDSGVLHIWPGVDSPNSVAIISYITPVEDFDASSDNPDFPQEWLDVLAYNLAAMAGPAYTVDLGLLGIIKQTAERLLWEVTDFNADKESSYFNPDMY